jgi:hypothetical protein
MTAPRRVSLRVGDFAIVQPIRTTPRATREARFSANRQLAYPGGGLWKRALAGVRRFATRFRGARRSLVNTLPSLTVLFWRDLP